MPDYFVQPGLVGLKLLSSKAAASATMLTGTFSMVLPAMYSASALNIIYAHGDVGSDGTIQQHTVLTKPSQNPATLPHQSPFPDLVQMEVNVKFKQSFAEQINK